MTIFYQFVKRFSKLESDQKWSKIESVIIIEILNIILFPGPCL